MIFASGPFVLLTLTGLLLFWTVPGRWRANLIFPSLNALFLIFFMTWPQVFFLLAFVLAGYLFLIPLQKRPAFGLAAVGVILLAFLYLRQYPFLSFLPYPENFPFVLGLSYVFFRVMQLVIDVRNGDITALPSLPQYFNFTCNYLTILSGPIQRYQDFEVQSAALSDYTLTEVDATAAVTRVLVGFLKAGPIAAMLMAVHQYFLAQLNLQLEAQTFSIHNIALFGSAALYLIFLYFNFSGYTDIVIGLARLFGMFPPENFNKPFAANNFIDLWQRWHMSLGNWMKLYVFNPTLTYLMRRVKNPVLAPYLSALAFFITFVLLGYWHGTTATFLLCGLMLGTGMALNKIYQVNLKNRLGKARMKTLQANYLYQQLCFGLTFAWLSFSIVGFWADWDMVSRVVANAESMFLIMYLGVCLSVAALSRAILDVILNPIIRAIGRWQWVQNPVLHLAYLAFILLVLVFYFVFWNTGELGFVYEGF